MELEQCVWRERPRGARVGGEATESLCADPAKQAAQCVMIRTPIKSSLREQVAKQLYNVRVLTPLHAPLWNIRRAEHRGQVDHWVPEHPSAGEEAALLASE